MKECLTDLKYSTECGRLFANARLTNILVEIKKILYLELVYIATIIFVRLMFNHCKLIY